MLKEISFFAIIATLYIASESTLCTKDNGDIYVTSEETTKTQPVQDVSLDEVMKECNASFSIPMDYLIKFNATTELPNVTDKTGMCYIRCFYEKSGLIKDWQLNGDKIRQYIWPATGDSISYCQKQGSNETNACVRLYAIAKCLMLRAITDAKVVVM